jgi:hypothetical protein
MQGLLDIPKRKSTVGPHFLLLCTKFMGDICDGKGKKRQCKATMGQGHLLSL